MLEPPPRPTITFASIDLAILAPIVIISVVGFGVTPSKCATLIPASSSKLITLSYIGFKASIAGVVTSKQLSPYSLTTAPISLTLPAPKIIFVS